MEGLKYITNPNKNERGRVMKKLLFLTILVVWSAGIENVRATDYFIGPGEYLGGLIIGDNDTLLMTGGTIEALSLGGYSIANIENTSPLGNNSSEGGIWSLTLHSYSTLNLSGGEINNIESSLESTVNMTDGSVNSLEMHYMSVSHLYGGQIGTLASDQLLDVEPWWPDSWIHIYCLAGYNYDDDTNLLTGQWGDGADFSISLSDIGTFPTYELIEFHIVPEPITFLLFAVGGIIAGRRKMRT